MVRTLAAVIGILLVACGCKMVGVDSPVAQSRSEWEIKPGMLFSEAEERMRKRGAEPTTIQIRYPDPSGNTRKELYSLRDGRVIDLTLARRSGRSPWIVEAISEVFWTGGPFREKQWIPMDALR